MDITHMDKVRKLQLKKHQHESKNTSISGIKPM